MTKAQLAAKELYRLSIELLIESDYTIISISEIAAKIGKSEGDFERAKDQLPKGSELAEILDTEIENKMLEYAGSKSVSNQYLTDMYQSEFNVKIEDFEPLEDNKPFVIVHLGRPPKDKKNIPIS